MSQPALYGNEHGLSPAQKSAIDHAVDTYEKSIKNCLPEEYPDWVKAVHYAILSGNDNMLKSSLWMDWVYPAYVILKAKSAKSSTNEVR